MRVQTEGPNARFYPSSRDHGIRSHLGDFMNEAALMQCPALMDLYPLSGP